MNFLMTIPISKSSYFWPNHSFESWLIVNYSILTGSFFINDALKTLHKCILLRNCIIVSCLRCLILVALSHSSVQQFQCEMLLKKHSLWVIAVLSVLFLLLALVTLGILRIVDVNRDFQLSIIFLIVSRQVFDSRNLW